MSTKLFSRNFSAYGEYTQLQIPYCNGIVLGAVKLNHKFNKDDIIEYGNDKIKMWVFIPSRFKNNLVSPDQ